MNSMKLVLDTMTELCDGKQLNGMQRVEFLRFFRGPIQDVISACPNQSELTAQKVVWRLGEVLQTDPREIARQFIESK